MDTCVDTGQANKCSIALDSRVTVYLGKGPVQGIVRWIGNLPGHEGTRVGLELVCKGKLKMLLIYDTVDQMQERCKLIFPHIGLYL